MKPLLIVLITSMVYSGTQTLNMSLKINGTDSLTVGGTISGKTVPDTLPDSVITKRGISKIFRTTPVSKLRSDSARAAHVSDTALHTPDSVRASDTTNGSTRWGGHLVPSGETNNQVLTTDGAGTWSWTDKGGVTAGFVESINGSNEAAQTISGDNGLQVVDSGSGNQAHKIRPSSGRIIPTGSGNKVDSSHISDTAIHTPDTIRAAYKSDTSGGSVRLAGLSKSYYDTAGNGANRTRENHTGVQAISTVTGLLDSLAEKASENHGVTIGYVPYANSDTTFNESCISASATKAFVPKLYIGKDTVSSYSYNSNAEIVVKSEDWTSINIITPKTHYGDVAFGDTDAGLGRYSGRISYNHVNNKMSFSTKSLERVYIDSTGKIGINDDTPDSILTVNGSASFTGNAKFNGNINTDGFINVDDSGTIGKGLKITSGKTTVLAGADTGAYTVTDNTRKTFNLVTPAYDTDEEPVGLLSSYCSPLLTSLVIGNDARYGTLINRYNALTEVTIKLAQNINTLGGAERIFITYDTSKFSNTVKTSGEILTGGNITVNRNIGYNQIISDWYRGMYQSTLPLFMEIASTGNGHEWHSKDTNTVNQNGFSLYTRRTGQGVDDSLRYRLTHSYFYSAADSARLTGTINGVAHAVITQPSTGWLIQTNIDSLSNVAAYSYLYLDFEGTNYPVSFKYSATIAYQGYNVGAATITRSVASGTYIDTVFCGNRAGKVFFYVKKTGSTVSLNPCVKVFTPQGNRIVSVKDTAKPTNTTALWNSGGSIVWVSTVIRNTIIVQNQLYKGGSDPGTLDSTGIYVTGDTLINGSVKITKTDLYAPKIMLTKEGGYAIKITNRTGTVSVKGYIVSPSPTYDTACTLSIVNVPDCIGVVYESGIANGNEMWVVVSGIVDVYFVGNATRENIARGFVTGDAGYVPGQALSEAVPSSPFATDKHFYEIGHVIQSHTGAGLARCVLHQN